MIAYCNFMDKLKFFILPDDYITVALHNAPCPRIQNEIF